MNMSRCKTHAIVLPMVTGLLLALGAGASCADDYKIGDKLAPARSQASPKGMDYKLTDWDALMPEDWDPMKDLKLSNFAALSDSDPRAQEAFERVRRAWDTAPTVPAMDGQHIRIAGFVVPMDGEGSELREFLLVPYFGACIHVPPPPANQVIHVTAKKPIKGVHMMDALWVNGTLHDAISGTAMGASGYRMDAEATEPYRKQ
jgi:hypothetical protein